MTGSSITDGARTVDLADGYPRRLYGMPRGGYRSFQAWLVKRL